MYWGPGAFLASIMAGAYALPRNRNEDPTDQQTIRRRKARQTVTIIVSIGVALAVINLIGAVDVRRDSPNPSSTLTVVAYLAALAWTMGAGSWILVYRVPHWVTTAIKAVRSAKSRTGGR